MALEEIVKTPQAFDVEQFCKPLDHELELELEPELVKKLYRALLNKKVQETKFQGFRPGKAPVSWVEQRHQLALQQEATERAVELIAAQAIKPYHSQLSGKPRLIAGPHKAKGSENRYIFKIAFERLPEIHLSRLSSYQFKMPKLLLDDMQINDVIERLRREQATQYHNVTDSINWGDQLILSQIHADPSQQNGEAGSATVTIMLDPKLRTAQTLTIHPSDDDEIAIQDLLNASVGTILRATQRAADPEKASVETRKLRVLEILRKTPVEITSDWITSLGVKNGQLEMLKTHLKNHLSLQSEQQLSVAHKMHLVEAVLRTHTPLPIPFTTFLEKLKLQLQNPSKNSGEHAQEMTVEQTPQMLLEQASDEACWTAYKNSLPGVIFEALIRKYQPSVKKSAVIGFIERYSQLYESPQRAFIQLMNNQSYLAQIQQHLLEEEIIKLTGNHWQVTEEEVDIEAFFSAETFTNDAIHQ